MNVDNKRQIVLVYSCSDADSRTLAIHMNTKLIDGGFKARLVDKNTLKSVSEQACTVIFVSCTKGCSMSLLKWTIHNVAVVIVTNTAYEYCVYHAGLCRKHEHPNCLSLFWVYP